MKAILLQDNGFEMAAIEIPEISANEVLVKVKAISINPVDTKTRNGKGLYGRLKDLDPLILGWDIAGTVEQTGSMVTKFQLGDEVFGMVNFPGHGKAYAAYVAAHGDHLAHKPSNISFEEAAASTLAALTAYQALVKKANIEAGQQVLIHAAAGGVGHFAVQIAKHLGAYVWGTSSEKNKDFVKSLGADKHIDYHTNQLDEIRNIDFCLDAIGGENIDRSLPLMKKGGTIISIPSGLNELVTEKAKAMGVNGYFFLVESNGDDMKVIADWLEKGTLKAHVSEIFPFEQMMDAHRQVETGRTVGKVVVTV